MTRKSFTQNDVEKALADKSRPKAGQRREHPAGGNLYLMVFRDGPGRWRWGYRPRGIDPATGKRSSQRKVTIGTTETHALAEAKREAAALRLRVAKGEDPAQADRAAAAEERAAVVAAAREAALEAAARVSCRMLTENYRAVLASRARSEKHIREELAQIRIGLESVNLMDAAPMDITAAHVEKITALCPAGSRRLRFGALDRFLRWSLRTTGATAPTASFERHERPKLPPRRQRVLAPNELAAVWNAAGTLGQDMTRDMVRFLVSVPCREGEAAAMRWRDVDTTRRIWTMPDSKNTLPHRFPLTDRALAILRARRAMCVNKPRPGDLVFPAPKSEGPFNSWSRLKRALDLRLDPPPRKQQRVKPVSDATTRGWRFHDLRRTAATAMGEAGYDMGLIDLILNHKAAGTRGGVGGTYNVSIRWVERVAAMKTWDGHIGRALGEVQTETAGTADVLSFPGAALARGAA